MAGSGITSGLKTLSIDFSIIHYCLGSFPVKEWGSALAAQTSQGTYKNVKHSRNIKFARANLLNTITALGALYIAIFELIRVYKGKTEHEFSTNLIYKHLKPRQELFLLQDEEQWRDIAEGKIKPVGVKANDTN